MFSGVGMGLGLKDLSVKALPFITKAYSSPLMLVLPLMRTT